MLSRLNIREKTLRRWSGVLGRASPSATEPAVAPPPPSSLPPSSPVPSPPKTPPPVQTLGLAPQSTFEAALQQRLQKILDPTERSIFKSAQQNISPDELLLKVKDFDDAYNRSSTSRKCAGTLTKCFQILDQFMRGVAIGIQASPEISTLVVGGVRLVIDVAVKFVDFFNKLTETISRLGGYLETLALCASAAGDIALIREALLNAYEEVFTFCKNARSVFVNQDGTEKKFTSTKTFFRVQWEPFEVRFGEIEAKFKYHLDVLLHSTQSVQLKSLLEGFRDAEEERRRVRAREEDQIQKDLQDRGRRIRLWLKSDGFKAEQRRRQKQRVDGTNAWFLQQSPFTDWAGVGLPADNRRLLWINGKPGCGKSILASSVVHQLQELDSRPTVLYFFFNSKSGTKIGSDPVELVRAFLVQLLDVDPRLLNSLYAAYTTSASEEASSFDDLWKIFHQWCFQHSDQIFCVIDALDEAFDGCEDPGGFLATIVDTVKSCKVLRMCITSRPNRRIEQRFSPGEDVGGHSIHQDKCTPPNNGIRASTSGSFVSRVTIRESQVSSDIMAYLNHKVKTFPKLNLAMTRLDINTLCERAEGMFLWIHFMIDELSKATDPESFRATLNQAPRGLDKMYGMILNRLLETLSKSQLRLCRGVLKWTTTAKEPLTANQLAVALAVRDGDKCLDKRYIPFNPREEILAVCAPLVEILEDNTVRIVHLSVKEFLFHSPAKGAQADFTLSRNSANADLGVALLTLLSFSEFRSTSFSNTLAGENDSLEARQMLQYGLRNWHLHCKGSGTTEKARLLQLTLNYLNSENSFLWMEHMALYEYVNNWIHIENQLLAWGGIFNVENGSSLTRGIVHQLAARRFEHLKKNLGETHPETVAAMADLAGTYWNQGRLGEAEALEVGVLEGRKKDLGDTHPNTLKAMANLAGTYWNQGRLGEAEALDVDVLEGRKKDLGDTHPDTLSAMANLAGTYRSQGRLSEAEALEVGVLEGRKKDLGDTHPDTLSAMANLAGTYRSQGRLGEAEALEVDVLEGRKKDLGDTHPDTLSAMANLAATYQSQGRLGEAEALEVGVLEGRKKNLGDTHPGTLSAMASLAATYRDQGRLGEAEVLAMKALEGYKRALGDTHPDTMSAVANLAKTYRKQGRLGEAEASEMGVLEGRKKGLGDTHPDTLSAMTNLAKTYREQGRLSEAEALEAEVKKNKR